MPSALVLACQFAIESICRLVVIKRTAFQTVLFLSFHLHLYSDQLAEGKHPLAGSSGAGRQLGALAAFCFLKRRPPAPSQVSGQCRTPHRNVPRPIGRQLSILFGAIAQLPSCAKLKPKLVFSQWPHNSCCQLAYLSLPLQTRKSII